MILSRVKQYTYKKYINALLSDRNHKFQKNKIKSLGVILNADEFDNLDFFYELGNKINIDKSHIKEIKFTNNKSLKDNSNFVTPKDISWKGTLKSEYLKAFVNHRFDLLINYYNTNHLDLKLISVLSHANLKVGILNADERLNDLIIGTKTSQEEVFTTEVIKYINILH